MLFSIQPDGPVPIYEQIVAQVIYGVAAGSLEVGTFIPSVRELAEQLLVHPNTVARAFQELERAGVVTPRRGRGMEVTEQAPAACRARRQELVRGRIRQALREAADSVLPPDEIRRLVEEELAAVNGKRKPREKR
jgi:GntR family transcriptional regulator